MPVGLVMLLNFTVNDLILLAAGGICGVRPRLERVLTGAAVGAVYAAMCLLPGPQWLGSFLMRMVSVLVMGLVTFGMLGPSGVVWVLNLAVDGVVSGVGIWGMLLGSVLLLGALFFKGNGTVPVELQYGEQKLKLKALRDTGNCLRDPVTGCGVMVIGPEAAQRLTGLSELQLRSPLQSMGAIPGLRLIPYKAVGSSGFLLALKLPRVRIGGWKGSYVVAFAPEGLRYEALIGGSV